VVPQKLFGRRLRSSLRDERSNRVALATAGVIGISEQASTMDLECTDRTPETEIDCFDTASPSF
jgi:hypothetical protein